MLKPFSEYEAWIMITTVMKTSEKSKKLSKEQRDQLFLELHRNFAPSLGDNEVKHIEKNIDQLATAIQRVQIEEVMKRLGTSDKEKVFKEAEKIVGIEDVNKIKNTIQEVQDRKLT